MRVVWSFWSRPFEHHRHATWNSRFHHLLAWVLSVESARQHYGDTELITDQHGAALLVDRLGLRFARVTTLLDALHAHDPRWWVLGKLYAYRSQQRPFVHVDSDVFLWKALPSWLTGARLFAQNPEQVVAGQCAYQPDVLDTAVGADGWLPDEWRWYRACSQRIERAICCGIIGGHAVEFINHYADAGVRLLEAPVNQTGLRAIENASDHCILVEQYFLNACLEYHRVVGERFLPLDVSYLFADFEDAYAAGRAKEVGFTHLLGSSKSHPTICARLEARVREQYPAYYQRCERFADS